MNDANDTIINQVAKIKYIIKKIKMTRNQNGIIFVPKLIFIFIIFCLIYSWVNFKQIHFKL